MNSWRQNEARNQALFREVNERIDQVGDSFGPDELRSFVCECGNAACAQLIHASQPEYERIRARGNHFLVAVNHENPEAESVVEENVRFAVVETYAGAASQIARESDPRSQQAKRRPTETH